MLSTDHAQLHNNHTIEKSSDKIFETNTHLHILDITDAVGFDFDYLWIMGLDDEHWPLPPQPNPFIPIQLQRQHKIPSALALTQTNHCHRLTELYLRSARNIVLSYAQTNGETPLVPSSLITHIPESSLTELSLNAAHNIFINSNEMTQKVRANISLNEQAPPLQPDEMPQGGSYILKAQANCPFQAFAALRLGAEPLPDPQPGLDPLERGTLIHHALAYLWHHIKNQQQLLTLSADAENSLIEDSIDDAIKHTLPKKPLTLSPRFIRIEKKTPQKTTATNLSA